MGNEVVFFFVVPDGFAAAGTFYVAFYKPKTKRKIRGLIIDQCVTMRALGGIERTTIGGFNDILRDSGFDAANRDQCAYGKEDQDKRNDGRYHDQKENEHEVRVGIAQIAAEQDRP